MGDGVHADVKIDKVVFSTSERFSVFWPLQSRVWRTKFNIEPVCLLFGENRGLSEEFGRVIEMPVDPDLPLLIQITWSKFWWPTTEPESTWLVGDIDLIPLSTHWFTDNIASVPDDHYVHLDADGITQLAQTPRWCGAAPSRLPKDIGCPSNLPGHYHCGKGRVLDVGLERSNSLPDELRHIVHSKLYRNSRGFRPEDPIDQHDLWCAEELRSTRALRRQIAAQRIAFTPFSLRSGVGRIDGDTVEKDRYIEGRYDCDEERLRNGGYVDLHMVRPFIEAMDASECARRERANVEILRMAGMLTA